MKTEKYTFLLDQVLPVFKIMPTYMVTYPEILPKQVGRDKLVIHEYDCNC